MRASGKAAVMLAAMAALLLAGGGGGLAEEEDRSGLVWMSGDEIRRVFSGSSLAGLYPSEKSWTETVQADGTTDYREGTKHWHGQWWVRDHEFCFSYPPPGVGGCFRVTRISANCYELYEFDTPAAANQGPPNIANLWNGRMWHSDRPTTCENRPSV